MEKSIGLSGLTFRETPEGPEGLLGNGRQGFQGKLRPYLDLTFKDYKTRGLIIVIDKRS